MMCTWRVHLVFVCFCTGYCDNSSNVETYTELKGSTTILNCAMEQPANWYRETDKGTAGDILFEGHRAHPKLANTRLSLVDHYDLQIVNLTKADEGRYCCDVVKGHFHKLCYQLIVLDPMLNIIQLDNDSLLCNVTDVPMKDVTFTWTHYSRYNQYLRTIDTGSDVLLNVNNSEDKPLYSVDGRYICSIKYKNQDIYNKNEDTSSKDVAFRGTPSCIPTPYKIFGYVHKSVDLGIHVYSSDIYSVSWKKEWKVINNSSHYLTSYTRSTSKVNIYGNVATVDSYRVQVKIQNLTKDDLNKKYTVTVSNNYGNVSCITKLVEASIPEVPILFTVSLQNSGIRVSWSPGFDGGSVQTYVIEYRASDDLKWRKVNSTTNVHMISIIDLPATCYKIRMHSQNEIGRSNYTDEKSVCMSDIEFFSQKWLLLYITLTLLCTVGILIGQHVYRKYKNTSRKGKKTKRQTLI